MKYRTPAAHGEHVSQLYMSYIKTYIHTYIHTLYICMYVLGATHYYVLRASRCQLPLAFS